MAHNLPNLTARLKLVKSFVREGRTVADIGTDHAYLPVYLVNSGICPHAVACDIREGPLKRAKMTAEEYNASGKIDFYLTDGLEGIKENQADDIVIAGMGGELISEIILKCNWIKNPEKHLILQPMTAQEDLRAFLCENGFKIDKEAVALEKQGQKCYLVISAYYDGKKRCADPYFCYTGLLAEGGQNELVYLKQKANSLYKKANGLKKAKSRSELDEREAEQALYLADKIKALCETIKDREC